MIDLRSVSRLAVLLCATMLLGASAAQAQIKKGDTLLLLQLTDGDVSFVGPVNGQGYISAYAQTEWGGGLQIQHLVSEDWAIVLGGGVGTFREKDTPQPASLNPEIVYKQSSWNARLGFDRVVHITPRFHLFAGPGIGYWSGKAKIESDGTVVEERTRVHRVSLDGRMGAHVGLGEKFGLSGQIGRYIAHSTAKDNGAEAKWWPSGSTGAVGFFFLF
jgi:hypothetical protein